MKLKFSIFRGSEYKFSLAFPSGNVREHCPFSATTTFKNHIHKIPLLIMQLITLQETKYLVFMQKKTFLEIC